jgi:hypothetical protein
MVTQAMVNIYTLRAPGIAGDLTLAGREAPAPVTLEHPCRYLLRPPLALERLTDSSGRQIPYGPPHSRHDGSTHLLLDPLELIEKRSILIPRRVGPPPTCAPLWSPAGAGRATAAGSSRLDGRDDAPTATVGWYGPMLDKTERMT